MRTGSRAQTHRRRPVSGKVLIFVAAIGNLIGQDFSAAYPVEALVNMGQTYLIPITSNTKETFANY